VVVMIILGGIGNIWGVILGAIVVQYVDKTLLPWAGPRLGEIGTALGNPELGSINPSRFSFLLFGIALVLMMRFRPEGFVPSRQRAAEMHTAPPDEAIGSPGVIEEEVPTPEESEAGAAVPGPNDPDAADDAARQGGPL
jgi:branched-chain amino acid transport system permease protein